MQQVNPYTGLSHLSIPIEPLILPHGGIHINQKDDKPTHFEMAIFADSLKKGREDKRYIPGQTGGRIWLYNHEPKDKVSAWRKIPDHLNINNILLRRYERKVKNDNTVSVNGQIR